MEIKALSMAGSGPELSSYFPWRGQGKREEAAAVVSPLGVVLGFTFISPQRRGAGEGSKKKKKTGRKRVRTGIFPRKELCEGARDGEAPGRGRSLRSGVHLSAALPWLGSGTQSRHRLHLPGCPLLSVICAMASLTGCPGNDSFLCLFDRLGN